MFPVATFRCPEIILISAVCNDAVNTSMQFNTGAESSFLTMP